jgi:hypothetical protein
MEKRIVPLLIGRQTPPRDMNMAGSYHGNEELEPISTWVWGDGGSREPGLPESSALLIYPGREDRDITVSGGHTWHVTPLKGTL